MGKVECEKHGLTFGTPSCRHVEDAVLGLEKVVPFRYIDIEFYGSIPFCKNCLAKYALMSTDFVDASIFEEKTKTMEWGLICNECLKEFIGCQSEQCPTSEGDPK